MKEINDFDYAYQNMRLQKMVLDLHEEMVSLRRQHEEDMTTIAHQHRKIIDLEYDISGGSKTVDEGY